jgi:hypothetical protein
VKTPVPVPSVECASVIAGFADVDQQTPLAVTVPPPSAVIFPPEVAVVNVIAVAAVVVRVGTTIAVVVNERSFP